MAKLHALLILKSDNTTGRLMTSCSLLLVHTEPYANEDSLSVGKLIKHKSPIPLVLHALCIYRLSFSGLSSLD